MDPISADTNIGKSPAADTKSPYLPFGSKDSSLMNSILDSPLMDSLFSNPDLLQSMFGNAFANNPKMKKIYEQNPELQHMLKNPDMMKELFKAAHNPEYQKELMKSNDRALSHLETLPEGFNALRKAYSSVQEPMFQALDESMQLKLKDDWEAIEKSNYIYTFLIFD